MYNCIYSVVNGVRMVTGRGRKSLEKLVIQERHYCAENCILEMLCKTLFSGDILKVSQGPEDEVPLLFGS